MGDVLDFGACILGAYWTVIKCISKHSPSLYSRKKFRGQRLAEMAYSCGIECYIRIVTALLTPNKIDQNYMFFMDQNWAIYTRESWPWAHLDTIQECETSQVMGENPENHNATLRKKVSLKYIPGSECTMTLLRVLAISDLPTSIMPKLGKKGNIKI